MIRQTSNAATSVGLLLALFAGFPGCDRDAERSPAPSPSSSSALSMQGRLLAAPAAFDVVALSKGALIVRAEPATSGSRIVGERLDEQGRAVRSPASEIVVREPDSKRGTEIVEVRALVNGDRLGVVWAERFAGSAHIAARLFDVASGHATSDIVDLGATEIAPGSAGHVALAPRNEHGILVLHRAGPTPCKESHGACTRFEFHELTDAGALGRPAPLIVPGACPGGIDGLSSAPGILHYAMCTLESGRRVHTVFTIQQEPMYAVADHALESCAIDGFFALPDGTPHLFGRCDATRRAFRPARAAKPAETVDVGEPIAGCVGGSLEIHVAVSGPRRFSFSTPQDRLEAILPERIAPPGARAAWTGAALVVARASGAELDVRRFTCSGTDLVDEGTAGANLRR